MPTIIYNKTTGEINGIMSGTYAMPSEDQATLYSSQSDISTLTHFVENDELKTLDTPRPDDDHKVDPVTKTWVRFRPGINHERVARNQRSQLLAECDWVVTKYTELGQPIPEEWTTYRQALRDITTQSGFPTDIVWPTHP